jgi:rod shape-determining protein MreD
MTNGSVIILSLIFAYIFMLLPFPRWMQSFQPQFVLLVTLYWVVALPQNVGIGISWLNGLLLDGLQGTLLGENAICFAVLAYILYKIQQRFRLLSPLVQSVSIFFLMLLNQIMLFWIQGLQGQAVSWTWFFGCAFTSAVLWPWISLMLTSCINHFRLQ